MIAIAVDDEPLMLGALVKAINASPDISSVAKFSGCDDAYAWVEKNPCDIAFLDIQMRGMGGLSLAEKIMGCRPECKIVFCTGFEEYAIPAFRLHASGYLTKPISAEDVQAEINDIKGFRHREKLLSVKCFGDFDVFARGEPLVFKRSKTKELFAFLVDRNGSGVTAAQIGVTLWENDDVDRNQNYLHQLIRDLRQSLEAVGAGAVFKRVNYSYAIVPQLLDCDYFSYLAMGKPEFHGEYMSQYSWAEQTCGLLWSKEN